MNQILAILKYYSVVSVCLNSAFRTISQKWMIKNFVCFSNITSWNANRLRRLRRNFMKIMVNLFWWNHVKNFGLTLNIQDALLRPPHQKSLIKFMITWRVMEYWSNVRLFVMWASRVNKYIILHINIWTWMSCYKWPSEIVCHVTRTVYNGFRSIHRILVFITWLWT